MSSNEPNQFNYSYFKYKKQDESQQKIKTHIISQNRWTKEENELLLNIVKKVGPRKWKEISRIIKTKTGKQCRDHYVNCLDPKINNSLWTEEEEKILLLKYEEIGPHWSKIQKYLPGRTNLMVKNYINNVLKRSGNNFDKINAYGNDVNFFIDSKKMQTKDFTAIDINYLLNKPIAASEVW